MNKAQIQKIAEQATTEENLSWSVADVTLNPQNQTEWEIYYDAWGRKYHKLLFRISPGSDSTSDSIKTELRSYIRQLKESSPF